MRFPFILLDAGGAFLLLIPVLLILFMVGIIFLEAFIMKVFNYAVFKRCLRDSAIANLFSLGMGIMVSLMLSRFHLSQLILLILFFLLTIAAEMSALLLLNKTGPKKQIVLASLVMNLASYLVLSLLLLVING